MSDIESTVDREQLTLTFETRFAATPERVWQVWEDPRQLERWWGPPTWPATFTRHEVEPGGQSRYVMTGPDDETSAGWWTITLVDAPHRFEFDDGFAGADGEPDPSMPSIHAVVSLDDEGSRTRMTVVSTFASAEQLDQMIGMGMQDGMGLALAQIEGVLAG